MDVVAPHVYHFYQGRIWPQLASTYNIAARPNTTCIVHHHAFLWYIYLHFVVTCCSEHSFLITPYDRFLLDLVTVSSLIDLPGIEQKGLSTMHLF